MFQVKKALLNQFLDVILSLTRTKYVGYLRDIRRLTVALSRARLGLYILGRREIFETCPELKESFDRLLSDRSDSLTLVTGEMYGSISRLVRDEVNGTEMTGIEHLGQYVYEMTNAKIEAMKAGGQPPILAPTEQSIFVDKEDEGEGGGYGNGEASSPESEALVDIDFI